MKNFILKNIGLCILTVIALTSCTSESLFDKDEGTGSIRMNVSINSKITRSDITAEELQKLKDNCVIYISDKVGLLHKWVGIDNLPSDLTLKYDTYLAEAWSGDSVSASFDKKFYKGETSFNVDNNHASQVVSITCKIANVIGSVDISNVEEMIESVEVVFSTTRGTLKIENESLFKKAYFMMADGDQILNYHITYKVKGGEIKEKDGSVSPVAPGHEYRLTFSGKPGESTTGGAIFDIEIKEFEDEVDDSLIIYGKPSFSWSNPTLSVVGQIVKDSTNPFTSEILRVAAFNGFKALKLESQDMAKYLGNKSEYNLVNVDGQDNWDALKSYGIEVDNRNNLPNDRGQYVWFITFTDTFLNNLESSTSEYKMTITAVDGNGKQNSIEVRIANTQEAVKYEDPIVVDYSAFNNDKTAVSANAVTIPVTVADASKDLFLLYKESSSDIWQSQKIEATRASNITMNVEIKGLKENTEYQYKVGAGVQTDGKYEFESGVNSFKTESKFIIPNAGMENWFENGSNLWEPNSESNIHEFWDTGNHGSAQYKFVLTQPSTDFSHSGKSAKLESVLAVVKFAAGNLFAGEFKETITSLPMGAKVEFGKPYNGSHPKALRFYAKYTPATISHTSKDVKDAEFNSSSTDFGQVFIALATGTYTVNTHDYTYFDSNDPSILAYGEVTWKKSIGDSGLVEVIIPIEYKEAAKTTSPTHILIVASASKYGDYFAGGKGSVLYLDDFELLYE